MNDSHAQGALLVSYRQPQMPEITDHWRSDHSRLSFAFKQNSIPSLFITISPHVPFVIPSSHLRLGAAEPWALNNAFPSSVTEIVRCQIFGEFVELDVG